MNFPHDGEPWNVAEIRFLMWSKRNLMAFEKICKILGRTQAACKVRYREILRAQMVLEGEPLDTLKEWKERRK